MKNKLKHKRESSVGLLAEPIKQAKLAAKPAKDLVNTMFTTKILLAGLLVIILVASLSFLSYFGFSPVGKAYTIKEAPEIESYDLTKDPDLILSYLPESDNVIYFNFSLNLKTYETDLKNYTFKVTMLENEEDDQHDVYQVNLLSRDLEYSYGIDILSEGSVSDFYVSNDDNETDFKVYLKNGEIILKNTHYLSPGKTEMVLTDFDNTIYPIIINTEKGKGLNFRLNATSLLTPDLKISVVESVESGSYNVQGRYREVPYIVKYTDSKTKIVEFDFAVPSDANNNLILKIVSDVKGLKTTANYLLSISDKAYLLDQSEFPKISLTYTNKTNKKAGLTIDFSPVTSLQPFSLPCELDNSKVSKIISSSVKKIYSYASSSYTDNEFNSGDVDNDEDKSFGVSLIEVWNSDIPVNDLVQFEPKKGYFIELAETKPYTFTATCSVPIISTLNQKLPMNIIKNELLNSIELSRGWNLVSVPGILPISLDDIEDSPSLKLFECKTDYKCREIVDDKFLYPGKPYWIYAEESSTLSFNYEK